MGPEIKKESAKMFVEEELLQEELLVPSDSFEVLLQEVWEKRGPSPVSQWINFFKDKLGMRVQQPYRMDEVDYEELFESRMRIVQLQEFLRDVQTYPFLRKRGQRFFSHFTRELYTVLQKLNRSEAMYPYIRGPSLEKAKVNGWLAWRSEICQEHVGVTAGFLLNSELTQALSPSAQHDYMAQMVRLKELLWTILQDSGKTALPALLQDHVRFGQFQAGCRQLELEFQTGVVVDNLQKKYSEILAESL